MIKKNKMIVSLVVVISMIFTMCQTAFVVSADNTYENNHYIKKFSREKGLVFSMKDLIEDDAYQWPRTLLSYRVDFEGENVKDGELALTDTKTNKSVPFQLSEQVYNKNGTLKLAFVNFIASLPKGSSWSYKLSTGSNASGTYSEPAVTSTTEDGEIVLGNGASYSVKIPASKKLRKGEKIPAPITQVNRGNGWIGDSYIISPKLNVKSIETSIVDDGKLIKSYNIVYTFDNDGKYTVFVKMISGYEFVEMTETMDGFSAEDEVYMENAWTGFKPTKRYSSVWESYAGEENWMRMDQPYVVAYNGEDPAFAGPSRVENIEEEMTFRIAPFAPGVSWEIRPQATFTDENARESLGIFIGDFNKFDDHDYAVWASADILQVRFRYKDEILYWKWPIVTGSRQTCISFYDHEKDYNFADAEPLKMNSYNRYLRNYYYPMSLNKVKDWVLEYPLTAKAPEKVLVQESTAAKTVDDLIKTIDSVTRLVFVGGCNEEDGNQMIAERPLYSGMIEPYVRLRSQMTDKQYQKINAMLLLNAYICSQEEMGPIIKMLVGHPNISADGKSAPLATAYLFPDHPDAQEWADQFEKYLELLSLFNTRPEVESWEAKAGRWTENIGLYVYAFVRPTMAAQFAGLQLDGKNRFADPSIANLVDYLQGVLTAPVYITEETTLANKGLHRLLPPHGAHSQKIMSPLEFSLLGDAMKNYKPMLSEYALYMGDLEAPPMEAVKGGTWSVMADSIDPDNPGTNPHLKSEKYTGFGFVLRAAVDTPEEISVHLMQIDKGPNYRWGLQGQGGSGVIHYNAAGRAYTGHSIEDLGDLRISDNEHITNFGVYKDGYHHAIGMNVLERPLYNFDSAQFAEILSEEGPGGYSWPEYLSRSVMLIGSDYIVTYDDVTNPSSFTRYTWGVYDEEEMPNITILKGNSQTGSYVTKIEKDQSRAISYDRGGGDCMSVVTHKDGIKAVALKDKKNVVIGATVETPTSNDIIFQNDEEIEFTNKEYEFKGTVGAIRKNKNGELQMSLFHGETIGSKSVSATVEGKDLGFNLNLSGSPLESSGKYNGRYGGKVTLNFRSVAVPSNLAFYVDGEKVEYTINNSSITATLPAGQHEWHVTTKQPKLIAPTMLRTENFNGGAKVIFQEVAGADKYIIEVSKDAGKTWKEVGETKTGEFELKGYENGKKIHVRAIAANSCHKSAPANEYPVYVSDKTLDAPEGVKMKLDDGKAELTWGEVLGASGYELYRREKGKEDWEKIFDGYKNSYTDHAPGIIKAFELPGKQNNVTTQAEYTVYEYAVSAKNGNGVGVKSVIVDTDPLSWRNFYPDTELKFRRDTAYSKPPYQPAEYAPPKYYPN